MKIQGSITIYLSIILVSVIVVVNVLSEASRVSMAQAESKSFTYMATESVLAGYARQLFKDYGILLVWENQSVENQIKKSIQDNINMADLERGGTNFMNTELVNVKIDRKKYVTDEEGQEFVEQIISYMKYAGTINVAKKLVSKFKKYSKSSQTEIPDNDDGTNIVDKNSRELQILVKRIDEKITNLKEDIKFDNKIIAASQKIKIIKSDILSGKDFKDHDKNIKEFLKMYRELITELDIKASAVHSAIEFIKQYEEKKEQFLKENGYTSDARDYIDDNLKVLKNIEDIINKNRELNIFAFSNIDSNNVDITIKSIKNIEEIKTYLQSLKVTEATEHDKKNQSIYKQASNLLTNGIVSLVIEDISNVSNKAVSLSGLPTKLEKGKDSNNVLKNIKNKAVLSLYANMKFGNYLKPIEDNCLKYGMEYIVGGKDTDKDNLRNVIERLAAVRNVANVAYLVSDKEKMQEISSVSMSAAAALGLPFLEIIIKGVLIEAWSLVEAVSDVRMLFKGDKVPVIKSKSTWNTSLKSLNFKSSKTSEKSTGLDYETYLELLIMLGNSHNCTYRIMDLMQLNIQNKYNKNFLMSKCFYSIGITATLETKPLFTAMPWTVGLLSGNNESYKYRIKCFRQY